MGLWRKKGPSGRSRVFGGPVPVPLTLLPSSCYTLSIKLDEEILMKTGRLGDRRNFIRVPFSTEVEIDAGNGPLRSDRDITISMCGMSLSVVDQDAALPPVGAFCRVSVVLQAFENSVIIEAGGKVTRSEPGSLAVEFTELDLDSYHHLRQLILNNTDDPEKAEQEFVAHWGIRQPSQKWDEN